MRHLFFFWVQPLLRDLFRQSKVSEVTTIPISTFDGAAGVSPIEDGDRLIRLWRDAMGVKSQQPNLWYIIFRFCGGRRGLVKFMLASLWISVVNLSTPLLIRQIILVVEKQDEFGLGLAWTAALVATLIGGSAVLEQLKFRGGMLSLSTFNGLSALLFEKPAKLSRSRLSNFSDGQIVTLLAADTRVLIDAAGFIPTFLVYPLQGIFALGVLYSQLGWVFSVGLAIIVANFVRAVRRNSMP